MQNRRFAIVVALLALVCAGGNAQSAPLGQNAPELFEKGMNALQGSSATRSVPNAIDYFRRSAELGFAPAQVVLGYFYDTGRGVTADPREALELYKKAGQQDDPLAQWLVGRMIYAGLVPPRDLNEAQKWLEKSSAHGNPFADYLLGKIALERSDYAGSESEFRQAAEQGLPQAQRALAQLLRDGHGAPPDYVEGYVWLLMSYDAGLRDAMTDLQALEAELSSTQVDQAKSKAREREGTMSRSAASHGCTGWPGEFDAIPTPPPPDLQRFCR
jgi:TPR repeat protein